VHVFGPARTVGRELLNNGDAKLAKRRNRPKLNDRARGWLRFLFQKATTKDDWTSKGVSDSAGGGAARSTR